MSEFTEAVRRVVRSIPRGKTLGYGQVALLAGKPGAARAVVQAQPLNPDRLSPDDAQAASSCKTLLC